MLKNKKMWRLAQKRIPGGNSMLTKNPKMFVEDMWPTYFSKSKDCFIWDLDGRKYTDMSYMGVGTNLLGYNNAAVDRAVIKTINSGNMTTLNCPEEVLLADKLVKMHPWSDAAKFARTGAEANSIAIRLARASTKKNKIIICGYHGWHDWYLAANFKNEKNLNNHLFPNVLSSGVPKALSKLIYKFEYNNLEELKKIIKNDNDIAAVIMEVERSYKPKNDFLKKVKRLLVKNKILLIYDECTSGFRYNLGGLHLRYKINPDLAMFGKALGNGYAINAILGSKKVMVEAKNTFISSTFWTERIGPTAALSTIKVMEKTKPWIVIKKKGVYLIEAIKNLAIKHDLKISFIGTPAIITFNFVSENNFYYIKYITIKMLEKNFLATNAVYVSIKHNNEIIKKYLKILDKIFKQISDCEKKGNIKQLLPKNIKFFQFSRQN